MKGIYVYMCIKISFYIIIIHIWCVSFIYIYILCLYNYRRKFRSQTSDNMNRWKSRGAKSQTGAESEGRKVGREKIRRKKMQVCEKVGKSRNTVFFRWFVAPEGRKVGSLKRRARRHLGRWEMKSCTPLWRHKTPGSRSTFGAKHISESKWPKHTILVEVAMSKKCTPLWREAHFEVKMYKTHQVRTTFGSWDVEKVHAVVARSTFRSQNVQNTPGPDHFWQLRCRKSARRCGAKHISKSKCTKHTRSGPLLAVEISKKCTPLWREAHFEVKMYKTHQVRTTFGSWDIEKVHAAVARSTFRSENVQNTTCSRHFWRFGCRFAWQAQRIVHLVKSEQNVKVLQHFQKRWQAWGIWRGSQRCISRGRCSTKDMFIRDVRRSGRSFPERGCILEYQIFRFAEMILRDRCSTSYDLASIFPGKHSTLHRWSGKIAKRIGTRLPALHSTFHFWRKSRRIALLLTLLKANIEEVSQNCCGFGHC